MAQDSGFKHATQMDDHHSAGTGVYHGENSQRAFCSGQLSGTFQCRGHGNGHRSRADTSVFCQYGMTLSRDTRVPRSKRPHEAFTKVMLYATSAAIMFCLGVRPLRSFPVLSERDIEALDDCSSMVKLLLILQVSWLVIRLCRTRGLPSSRLEIAILAFSVSSLIIYFML